jgi:uncharacterized protein YndB with AHSA1/START domain
MTTMDQTTDVPVRKSITVNATAARAFQVFTEGFDSWWPRSHHIGSSPMKKAIIEGFVRGRCYSEQIDGTDCDWGQVLEWEPPRRFVIAWQINGEWKHEPDLAKSSEVEVRFTSLADGTTRVDLEHRHLSRHGAAAASIRAGIDAPGGWGSLLQAFAEQVDRTR